jgi:hypothetical protein
MKKDDFLALLNAIGIDATQIVKTAMDTGLQLRTSLVKPVDILYAFCQQSVLGTVSFNDLAAKIDAEAAVSVSRQAIAKRVGKEACMDFLKKILALVISAKIDKKEISLLRQGGKFKRVLVQDSTIIGLPGRLFDCFSGVSNGNASVCNARIQCVYDLLAENFICFTIDPYTKNDLKAAPELCLQKDDLVIRDRGYLTNSEIQRHLSLGAGCIFRHKSKMIFLDIQTGKEIDLLAELTSKKQLDTEVTLNNKERTKVRIVAFPVSEEIANSRRMRAKKEMKKLPSKECLLLLSWSIFITTINQQDADHDFIFKTYTLRWRIEIIFKSWKSNMEFSKIHNVSKIQLYLILYARFIMIIICIQHIFSPARIIIKKLFERELSMIKVVHYLMKNTSKILLIVKNIEDYRHRSADHIHALSRYCSYEKRTRLNFEQEFDALYLS